MKTVSVSAFILLFVAIPSFASSDAKVTNVTVFRDRASITRSQSLNLTAGAHSVQFEHVTPNLDVDSLTAHISDKKSVTVLGIRVNPVYTAHSGNKDLESLKSKLTDEQQRERDIGHEVEILLQQNQNLRATATHYRDSFMVLVHKKVWERASFERLVKFLESESGKLNGEWAKLYERHEAVQKSIVMLQNKINEMSSDSDAHTNSVYVDLVADRNTQTTVDIQYIVPGGAGWSPTYDIYMSPDGKSGSLEQNAFVWQKTGEDWNNVKLTLSNVQDELRPEPPSIEKYILNYQVVKKVQTDVTSSVTDTLKLTENKKDDQTVTAEPAGGKKSEGIEQTFIVPSLNSVKSGMSKTKVPVAKKSFNYEDHLELVAAQYPYVYRKAEFHNPFNWDLASGPLNIFYDGNFEQQAVLEKVAKNGVMGVNSGVDYDVQVSRSKSDKSGEKGLISKKNEFIRIYETTLKNFSSKPKHVKILEQVPISQINEVAVNVDGSEGFQKDDLHDGWYFKEADVKPRGSEKIRVSLSLLVPKDFNFSWNNLDVSAARRFPAGE